MYYLIISFFLFSIQQVKSGYIPPLNQSLEAKSEKVARKIPFKRDTAMATAFFKQQKKKGSSFYL